MREIVLKKGQAGSFLLEALIGVIIFVVGALTMIALQATGIAAQTDAQSRIEASNLVDRMIGQITVNVDRSSAANLQTSLLNYAHMTGGSNCNFTGSPSADADVTAWVTAAVGGATTKLPGTTTAMQQILVDTASFNKVTVTLCWQGSADAAPRRHTVIAYIN